MANNFFDNKERWLQIANSEFDYSIQFIKAWLPFNAWYCNCYPIHKNRDRPILEEIKKDNNLYRNRIISLLDGNDEDSEFFRFNLVKLHKQLELCKVPNATTPISFCDINYRENPETIWTKIIRNDTFKIEFITPTPPNNYKIKIDIVRSTGASVLTYLHKKYEKSNLLSFGDFIALSEANQKTLINGFDFLNPKRKESLIVKSKKDSLKTIKQIYFIDDKELLSMAIIEILYSLRCILFHGEIQPNKDNLKIYEPAYNMQRLLLKSLY
jgi:hypothetical protein